MNTKVNAFLSIINLNYHFHLHILGLVYFEALGILSNQSKMRIELLVKPLTGKALTELEETLEEVEELCEFPEVEGNDDDISIQNVAHKFETAVEDLSVKLNFKEIIW